MRAFELCRALAFATTVANGAAAPCAQDRASGKNARLRFDGGQLTVRSVHSVFAPPVRFRSLDR